MPDAAKTAAAPRLARPFVLVFLATMVAAAILVWEPWPITSFRLFSHLRQDRQHGWAAAAVDSGGGEEPLQLAELSSGFRGFSFRMAEFEASPWRRRDEICRTWVAPLASYSGGQEREIRLYRTSWRLSRRIDGGERPAPPSRALAFVCTSAGARRGVPR
jgi:hypothetical protein